MLECSKYPAAAATIQPTNKPTITAVDFMIGDPHFSQKTIVTKTRKPRPMNLAEPHGAAIGPPTEGQAAIDIQPEPPNQSSKPDWIKLIPISKTTGPVTIGGNNFCKVDAGMKDKAISSKLVTQAVPNKAP
ncbi:hypothetical protein WICPIJ_004832 [Wickerhamomyces pijperi]|uniref:Uncharacterized protein n=1 Tax=Wickerhamomyces pijperi TaxID=599730 RepID=A0A9P8Q796_WICPI|nr:hypothetical protein WICPIJ_004832 [Wickerhamomyces pijperi]